MKNKGSIQINNLKKSIEQSVELKLTSGDKILEYWDKILLWKNF